MLCTQFSTAFGLAASTNGLNTQVQLPATLDALGTNYTMYVTNQSVLVTWVSGGGVHTTASPIQLSAIYNATGATSFYLAPGSTYFVTGGGGVVNVT